jgi:undecaprenyl-diphosphatase
VVSRSGIVILVMMFLGYKRDQAAKYSFFLALPTILAAASLDIFKVQVQTPLLTSEIQALVIGFVSALVVALLVLRWFITSYKKIPYSVLDIIELS